MNYVLDIETRPNPELMADAEFWADVAEKLTPPANYRDPLKIEEWRLEQVTKQRDQAALKPWLGMIACIGIADVDSDSQPMAYVNHELNLTGERQILLHFLNRVPAYSKFLGWGIRGFDIPWLIARTSFHRLGSPGLIPRPRDWNRTLDLLDMVGGEGKLDDWSYLFSGVRKEVDGPALLKLSIDDLAAHCAHDVMTTKTIARATQWLWREVKE
jgi:hypothetical protein